MLTGETGAGKSILLDAFALALGARGDAALVRQGPEQGQVTAVFELPPRHPARALLADNGIEAEDELILRRVQFADGRTRAFVNDQPVSVQALKSLGAALVEIHGQHDDRALVDAGDPPRACSTPSAASSDDADEVARLWTARTAAREAVEAHRAEVERAQREADWLRHAVEELTQADARRPARRRALAERRAAMMQAEKVAERPARRPRGGRGRQLAGAGAGGRDAAARAAQRAGAGADRAGREGARSGAQRARGGARASRSRAARRPITIRASSSASRSGCSRCAPPAANTTSPVDGLAALAAALCRRPRADRCRRGESSPRLESRGAPRRMRAIARPPTRCRRARARRPRSSTRRSMRELKPLKLERAQFTTEIDSDPEAAGPHGIDRVEFWVQTNPGTRPGPLMKVASGGELARFLLALKVVLADRGSAPTLVFDEIDTGVGGAVADAIGLRLARLAERVQVIAVTHAPQVAARADRHYLITKDALDKGKRVATRVDRGRGRTPPRGDRPHAGRRRDHRRGPRRRRAADQGGAG